MVRASRVASTTSESDSMTKSKRKSKNQDGRQQPTGGSGNYNKTKTKIHSATKDMQSPMNSSIGQRKLPEIPDGHQGTADSKLTNSYMSKLNLSSDLIANNAGNGFSGDDDPVNETPCRCIALTCQKIVMDDENALICSKCERWIHQTCSTINLTEYKALTKKNRDNIMWFCDACLPVVTCFLQGRMSPAPATPSQRNDTNKKIDQILAGFKRLENAMVKNESNLEKLIEEKVESYLQNERDKDDRQFNLIFHNIPESTDEDITERKSHDVDQVMGILNNLEVQYTEVSQPTRLGKKQTADDGKGKPRLLRVKLASVEVKRQTLAKAKQLKSFSRWKRVYITPDLTFKEREESRKLRQELFARRDQGEQDIVIRRGKIVKSWNRNPFRDPQDTSEEPRGATSGD